MEITCLDRYDNNGEHNDISDMSNHSERSSNITSTISITSNNKINDHRYLTNNKEIVKIKSTSTSYDDEDDDDDDDEEESNDCCIKGQSLILWLRINYVDIFRGIGITFSQIPELITCAFIVGIKPEMAFISSWIIGIITTLILLLHNKIDKPYVNGMTISIAFILSKFIQQDNGSDNDSDDNAVDVEQYYYILYTIILAGIFQIIFGLLKFDVIFIKLISYPVYAGYLTSIGIIISLYQINYFKVQTNNHNNDIMKFTIFPYSKEYEWVDAITCIIMVFEILATILICVFIPQITKNSKNRIPFNIIVIPIITMFEFGAIRPLGYSTPIISDLYQIQKTSLVTNIFCAVSSCSSSSAIPSFLNMNTFKKIYSSSILILLSSLIDTYLTTMLINEHVVHNNNNDNQRNNNNSNKSNDKLSVGYGVGQFISGLLGGSGGATMLFQTFINVKSGSTSGISTISSSVTLICVMSFAYPVINIIPLSSIIGIMLYAAYHIIQWKIIVWILSFALPERIRVRYMPKLPIIKLRKMELSTTLIVIVISFIYGIEIGVIVGIILSLIDFTLQAGKRLDIRHEMDDNNNNAQQQQNTIIHISGPIYFGSCDELKREFSISNIMYQQQNDNQMHNGNGIILSLEGAEVFDYTGLHALHYICQELSSHLDKTIAFADVSPNTKLMMESTATMWESTYFLEYKDLENATTATVTP